MASTYGGDKSSTGLACQGKAINLSCVCSCAEAPNMHIHRSHGDSAWRSCGREIRLCGAARPFRQGLGLVQRHRDAGIPSPMTHRSRAAARESSRGSEARGQFVRRLLTIAASPIYGKGDYAIQSSIMRKRQAEAGEAHVFVGRGPRYLSSRPIRVPRWAFQRGHRRTRHADAYYHVATARSCR